MLLETQTGVLSRHKAAIRVLDLGIVEYEKAYRIQRELVEARKVSRSLDTLILAEHPPVYTIGRAGSLKNLHADREILASQGIKVLNVDRGGDITFHGPGQIVAYPILDLRGIKQDLHFYLRRLEDVGEDFLSRYKICAKRQTPFTGVWIEDRKICSIGIGSSAWVTYHGMSVNIDVDLKFFADITPCGIQDCRVTSLSNELSRPIAVEDVKDNFIDSFDKIFSCRR